MEEYYYTRGHIPVFGSWDWNTDVPFTECFETAGQNGTWLRYSYSDNRDHRDRDLYVAGDLYENHVVTPAMIVVPSRRRGKGRSHMNDVKEGKKQQNWMVNEVELPPSMSTKPTPKPIDEDLYKIPPELLYSNHKKKRSFGFFKSCLNPTCAV